MILQKIQILLQVLLQLGGEPVTLVNLDAWFGLKPLK